MLVALRPLFGLTCTGEAMPGATDLEASIALMEAPPLRAAMERAPAPVLAQDRAPEPPPPAPQPDFAPAPVFTPRR